MMNCTDRYFHDLAARPPAHLLRHDLGHAAVWALAVVAVAVGGLWGVGAAR